MGTLCRCERQTRLPTEASCNGRWPRTTPGTPCRSSRARRTQHTATSVPSCQTGSICVIFGPAGNSRPVKPMLLLTAALAGCTQLGMASASATVPATWPTCQSTDLRMSLSQPDGAGGHSGLVIRWQNNGRPCEMSGYPKVDGLDKWGRIVVHAKSTPKGALGGPGQSRPVRLLPTQSASALYEGTSGPVTGVPCRAYTRLAITSPGQTRKVVSRVPIYFCDPVVHPVVAGSSGASRIA